MYRVYVVDDEARMIKNVVSMLGWGENGFEVIGTATSPQQALSEISALRPDAVFCDLKMPMMDGIGLMQACRAAHITCEFIMLSAYGEFEATRRFFLMDGFDYLLKPLQPQEAELVLERLSRKLAEKYHLTPSSVVGSTGNPAFDELVAYVAENYNKKHTLKSLSRLFNISEKYICNLFSKHYQCSLTIFLTNLRMTEAARLIEQTNVALKEIAVECGYTDYFYFCRVFKANFSVSPTEYRQGGTTP